MNLLLARKMAIKLNKKNPIAKDLFTKSINQKLLSQKGKGSFKRKKK